MIRKRQNDEEAQGQGGDRQPARQMKESVVRTIKIASKLKIKSRE